MLPLQERMARLEALVDAELTAIKADIDRRAELNRELRAADQIALTIAREGIEHRLEGMNEFRNQLTSQASTFMSRSEIEVLAKQNDETQLRLQEEVRVNRSAISNLDGRMLVLTGIAFSGATGVGALLRIL